MEYKHLSQGVKIGASTMNSLTVLRINVAIPVLAYLVMLNLMPHFRDLFVECGLSGGNVSKTNSPSNI